MVHTPNHPYAPVQYASVPSPRTRARFCSMQPSTPNVAIEHSRPPASSETIIKRIRLMTGAAGGGAGVGAGSICSEQYSGSSSSKDLTDSDCETGAGCGAGSGSGSVSCANGPSPSSTSSSFPSGPYLFDLYDLPVTRGEKQVVDSYDSSMSYYHKPAMSRSFTTEMNEQTSYPSYAKSAAASAVSAPSAHSSSGPAFDTVPHSFHPDISPPSSPPTSPSTLSSSSSLAFDLHDWDSLEAQNQWNSLVDHASLQIPSMIRRPSELHTHPASFFGSRRNSRTIIDGLDTLMEENEQGAPLRIDVSRSISGTMDSIFPREEEQTQLHSLTESVPPTPSSSVSITAICPYPQLQVAPSPGELPIGQLARFLSTGGKEMRMEQEIEMLKQENSVAALPSANSPSVCRLVEEQTSTGMHTRRGSGSRRSSLLLAAAPTAAVAEALAVPLSPVVKTEKGKPGRKRSSNVAFSSDMVPKKEEEERMAPIVSSLPTSSGAAPLSSASPVVSALDSSSFTSSLFSTLPSTSSPLLHSTSLFPSISPPPAKRQKKSLGRPSSSSSSISSSSSASVPSSPTHSSVGTAAKPQKDRHVKTAKKLKPVQEGGLTNPVEVVPFYYSRPLSVQSALPSSLIAEPVTANTPPNTRIYKIRLITVENAMDGRKDVYVHGADIGGLVERKSNISRLFGKFESPSEKLLMNVVGTHNNLTGQESNILTVKGIARFLKTPKMRDQEHYKRFILDELLPKMKELFCPPNENHSSSQSTSTPVSTPVISSLPAPASISSPSLMIPDLVPAFSLNSAMDSIPSLIKDELASPQLKSHPQMKSGKPPSHSHSHPHSHSPSRTDTLSPVPATPSSPPSGVDDDDEDDLSDISSVASLDSHSHSTVHAGFNSPFQIGRA